MEDFYGTGIEIWAGFEPVAITEKKPFWTDYEQLLRQVFMGKKGKNRNKNILVSALFSGTYV